MQQVEEKTVDIDTSGPDTEVNLPEEQSPDTETVESTETSSTEPVEPVSEDKTYENERETKLDKAENQAEKKEEKDELKEYSEGVQRRIAKLTKKWREAERQKDEALNYAESMIKAKKEAEAKISKLEPGYMQSTEDGIKAGIEAAKAKLAKAREAGDINAEVEAQATISELGYKQAKFLETKAQQEEFNKNKQEQEKVKSPEIN